MYVRNAKVRYVQRSGRKEYVQEGRERVADAVLDVLVYRRREQLGEEGLTAPKRVPAGIYSPAVDGTGTGGGSYV